MAFALTELEIDLLGDMAEDSHELWEFYCFARSHHPDFSKSERISCILNLITNWFDRGWLRSFMSRKNYTQVSESHVLDELNFLGDEAEDANKTFLVFELTKKAEEDINWLKVKY